MKTQDLKQLISTLNDLVNDASGPSLGFCEAPTATIVYLNRSHGGVWYTWDHDRSEAQPIEAAALRGHVMSAYLRDKEAPGGVSTKLRVRIDAGSDVYELETGVDTTAARQLLTQLLQIADPGLPVTIAPSAGDEDSVIFVRCYQEGARIDAELGTDASGRTLWHDVCDAWGWEHEHYELPSPHASANPQPAAAQRQHGQQSNDSERIARIRERLDNSIGQEEADRIARLKDWDPGNLSPEEANAVADIIEEYEGPTDDGDSFEPDDDLPF